MTLVVSSQILTRMFPDWSLLELTPRNLCTIALDGTSSSRDMGSSATRHPVKRKPGIVLRLAHCEANNNTVVTTSAADAETTPIRDSDRIKPAHKHAPTPSNTTPHTGGDVKR